MRFREFKIIKEYEDPSDAKEKIISKVSGLEADNEEDAKILDKIYRIISSDSISSKISDAFSITTQDDPFKIDTFLKTISQSIFNAEVNYKSLDSFLDKLEADKAVNLSAFGKSGTGSLDTLFNGDNTAVNVFTALQNLGTGKKQKGPGEYALAVMSSNITLLNQEGDVNIKGVGKLEVKAETTSGGGRLGDGGPSNKVAKEYWSKLPSIAEHEGKGLGLSNFVSYLARDLPLNDPDKRKTRQKMLTDWYSQIFSNPAPIVEALMQDDPAKAELDYGKANFELYKQNYGWDVLFVINFPQGKFAVCRTGEDFAALRQSKQFGSYSISVIPSSARPSEVFAQISMTKSKT